MRRAAPIAISTLLGLLLLANFHTTPAPASVATPPASEPSTSTTARPSGRPPSGAPPSTGTASPPTTATPGASTTFDGSVFTNRFGDVQVRITVSGSRIVDAEALTLPSDRARSDEISSRAGPVLKSEALQAQSANIDTVSGATYTSDGYRQSLQSALDQAGLH
jgi:uncharacterized protein with FMN-binding domain